MINSAPTFQQLVLAKPVGAAVGLGWRAVKVIADGKFLIAESEYSQSTYRSDLVLSRYNADGSLDASFGSSGRVRLNFFGNQSSSASSDESVSSLLVDSDGKILVSGWLYNDSAASGGTGRNHFFIARFNPDGSLDRSFHSDGKLDIQDLSGYGYGGHLALSSNGAIVLVGTGGSSSTSSADWALFRFTNSGIADTSFNGVGTRFQSITSNTSVVEGATSAVVDSSGRLIVGGYSGTSPWLLRLSQAGSLDSSFGTASTPGRKNATELGSLSPEQAPILLQDTSGAFLLLATSGYDIAVARYSANGVIDTSFGQSGSAKFGLGLRVESTALSRDMLTSAVIQSDGKILIAGRTDAYGYQSSVPDSFVIRLNKNGTIDTSFGDAGKVGLNVGLNGSQVGPYNNSDDGMTVLADGKILLVGSEGMVRLTPEGKFDLTFHSAGTWVNTIQAAEHVEDSGYTFLDRSVAISDRELSSLNGGKGDFSGTRLTIERNGGANSSDGFSFGGGSAIEGLGFITYTNASLGSITSWGTFGYKFANWQINAGRLTIDFVRLNSIDQQSVPTEALVNAVASSITYRLSGDAPPSSVELLWTFSDGVASTQSSQNVVIRNVNDLPTGGVFIQGTPAQGEQLVASHNVVDPDNSPGQSIQASYQWIRNGQDIQGANSSEYLPQAVDIGTSLSVRMNYIDGRGKSETVTSVETSPIAKTDFSKPQPIDSFLPAVGINDAVSVRFNEPIRMGSVGSVRLERSTNSTFNVIESFAVGSAGNQLRIGADGWSLEITPTAPFSYGAKYRISIDEGAVQDLSGNQVPPLNSALIFDTEPPPDTAAPKLFAQTLSEVPIDGTISISFDELIQLGNGSVDVRSERGEILSFTVSAVANQLVLRPASPLPYYDHQYTISLSADAVRDIVGNSIQGAELSFRSSPAPELAPPAILSIQRDYVTGDDTRPGYIRVQFDEPIQPLMTGVLELQAVSKTDRSISSVERFEFASTSSLRFNGTLLEITPSVTSFAYDTEYRLKFSPGAIQDQYKNKNGEIVDVFAFETGAAPDTTAPVVSTFSPNDGSTDIAVGSSIVFTFSESIQKGVGSIEIRTESATGTIVETFNADTSSRLVISGSTLTIDPTNNLDYSKQYYVVASAGSVRDLAGNNYAGTWDYDFTTRAAPDTTEPVVSTFSPVGGAAGVAVGSNIVLNFSEAIQRGAGSIEIRTGSATGTIFESFDAAASARLKISGSTLTIDPTNDLDHSKKYYVIASSGSVRDLASNNYAGTSAYDFSTNSLPTGLVRINGELRQGQTLSVANTLADIDGLGEISYTWKSGSTTLTTGTTYALGQSSVGQAITVIATYTDNYGVNETVTSAATAMVANVNDVPTGSVTISGTARQGQTLSASNTLSDIDGLGTITYTWKAGSTTLGTGTTYSIGQSVVGQAVTVTANYTDSLGAPESVTSASTDLIANEANVPIGTVTLNGTPLQGQTLSVTHNLSDADGLGPITYTWKSGSETLGIGSAYTLRQADVGKAIHVVASYVDGDGTSESIASAAKLPVENINDIPTGTITISGAARQGQTLTATNSLSDSDGIPSTGTGAIAYQWKVNGIAATGATGDKYTLTQSDVGKAITVTASYTDNFNAAESVTSAATAVVANVNDVSTGSVTISGTARQGQTLTASHTLSDIDGLGDITYYWKSGPVTLGMGSSYTLRQADVGKAISVVAMYRDGSGTTERVTSTETALVTGVMVGTERADKLIGSAVTDDIRGLGANDVLTGGLGADQLDGGEGSDVYLIRSSADYAQGERINDTGNSGTDEIRFAGGAGTLTLTGTVTGIERLVVGTGSGVNAITTGASTSGIDASAIATALEIIGDNGRNSLTGGRSNDALRGNGGADNFNIIAGADRVLDLGVGGADVLKVSLGARVDADVLAHWTATAATRNDGIANLATQGNTVNLAAITSGNGFTVTNVGSSAQLTGSGMADTLIGGFGADTLSGGLGNDSLVGGVGNDVLTGGAGADRFVLFGSDTVMDYSSVQSDTIDLSGLDSTNVVTFTAVTGTLDASASLAAIKATAAASGLRITSGSGSDWLNGKAGADSLSSGAGGDTLLGEMGNDTIDGGTGADRMTGGAGRDRFVFEAGDSGQTVALQDVINDFAKGSSGDWIDYETALQIGGSASAATQNQASINQSTGVVTFAPGSGATIGDALYDIAESFNSTTDTKGEFAFFKLGGRGNFHLFISDGQQGVTPNDVVVQLVGLTSIAGANITDGNLWLA